MAKNTNTTANETTISSEVTEQYTKCPYVIGENYFIRTVTYHYTGRLIAVHDQELVLADAAWIADDGRFADALAKGDFNEIEPYPSEDPVVIGRGSVIDAQVFRHKLPRVQK